MFQRVGFLPLSQLYLSKMDFLKVVCDNHLVDEEAETLLDPNKISPAKNTQDEAMGDGKFVPLNWRRAPGMRQSRRRVDGLGFLILFLGP